MSLVSFHLAELPAAVTARALLRRPSAPGLLHIEVMAAMELGAPVVSPRRMQLRRCATFAVWADESALEEFLDRDRFGRRLADGWHVRLAHVRTWGHVAAVDDLLTGHAKLEPDEPVVAVTIARMRIPQVPRFLRWGRPVERQVRDDPGTTLALAAMRPPRTISTFTVWRSLREMVSMVHGRGQGPQARHHVDGMAERERRDFHHEFTTLRFRALSEHGSWQGRTDLVPVARPGTTLAE
ncbi:MAG TPA: hypothetical protein IAA98_10455 [Candidatus Avipropionibacterium avicola]|uniref:Spheroidene monooxygenase n=1 Tax=Candidatus Avipropionibacterium avicola TaxID=2840701 RepID=A0A9D1GYQ6_9ACTN|nr:hypothetical protein [Candidatus Avipropionibacterium avicola]